MNIDQHLATEEVIAEESIGVGDDVFTAGMFTQHIGLVQNRPIVRVGTIAAMAHDNEPVSMPRGSHPAYLIEARSIAGLSGSPVFVHMAPFRVVGAEVRPSQKMLHYFLGVLQGHYITRDASEVLSTDTENPGDMSTGIGVVVPGKYVKELINVPQLKEARLKAVEKAQRASHSQKSKEK